MAPDGDGWVALASPAWQGELPDDGPLAVKVLLDCSGSMQGDSIVQAKAAVVEFIRGLQPQDQFSLTRFGSRVKHVSDGMESLDPASRVALLLPVQDIDADLGGTEMDAAIAATLAIPASRPADILLITGGEVYGIQEMVARVAKSGHRLFVVAIGAAPNEPLATALARETRGAAKFVADSCDALSAILRMFKLIRQPCAAISEVQWGSDPPVWTLPPHPHAFSGDTIHAAAGFATRPWGELLLMAGETRLTCPFSAVDTTSDWLPRLLAARRLERLDNKAATALAVQHNLVSEYTSLVVVAKLQEGKQAAGLPRTMAIPLVAMASRMASPLEPCAMMAPPAGSAPSTYPVAGVLYSQLWPTPSAAPVTLTQAQAIGVLQAYLADAGKPLDPSLAATVALVKDLTAGLVEPFGLKEAEGIALLADRLLDLVTRGDVDPAAIDALHSPAMSRQLRTAREWVRPHVYVTAPYLLARFLVSKARDNGGLGARYRQHPKSQVF